MFFQTKRIFKMHLNTVPNTKVNDVKVLKLDVAEIVKM